MNILLLGSDPRHEPLLHGLATLPSHHVERRPDTRVGATSVNVDDFDALICAGPVRTFFPQIRPFLAGGKPVMVIPSAAQGSDTTYELLAVDEESGGCLIAGFPHRHAPAWREFRDRIQTETAEGLQLIQIERRLKPANSSRFLTGADVEETLLGDADLMQWLGSECTHVTCLYTGATEAGISRATVNLSGGSRAEAAWMMESDADADQCRASMSAGGESFSMNESGLVVEPAIAEVCAAGLLAELQRVSGGQPPDAPWMDAVRAFDVVDAARRSIRRRRTVEVSSGEVSERGQFKTKMTALGCSLLSLTFFGVLLALLIGAVFDPRDAMQRQSEAAGFVLGRDVFVPETHELTDEGRRLLLELSYRLRETSAEIIVESNASESNAATDERRRAVVVEFLREERALELDGRVVVRQLDGRWFQRFMTGLWFAVFLPLGVFLILQALIVVTRSPESADAS